MFSRIAEALRKMNAVTLKQLRDIIHNSYTPSPVSVYRENISDIKSWLRDFTCSFKNHSHPHAFHFKLNEQELSWWERFVEDEKQRRKTWEMTDEDYKEAGSNFDLLEMKYQTPPAKSDEEDEVSKKREEELLKLLEKNKFPTVSPCFKLILLCKQDTTSATIT